MNTCFRWTDIFRKTANCEVAVAGRETPKPHSRYRSRPRLFTSTNIQHVATPCQAYVSAGTYHTMMNKTDRVLPAGSSWLRRWEAEKRVAVLCDASAVTGGAGLTMVSKRGWTQKLRPQGWVASTGCVGERCFRQNSLKTQVTGDLFCSRHWKTV